MCLSLVLSLIKHQGILHGKQFLVDYYIESNLLVIGYFIVTQWARVLCLM